MAINFSTINWDAKKKLKINLTNYIICDLIYHYSNNPKNISGWCWANRKTLSEDVDISERTLYRSIEELITLNLLEMHEKTKFLRTTQNWYNVIVTDKMADDKLPECHVETDKMAVLYNNIYIDKDITDSVKPNTDIPLKNEEPKTDKLKDFLQELPDFLGSKPISRLFKVYSLRYFDLYGRNPLPDYRKISSSFKSLLATHTEYQISALILLHFDWHGSSGNDEFSYKQLSEKFFPITWIPTNFNAYSTYITNVIKINFDDKVEIKKWVVDILKDLKAKQDK